tara:strand:+ start:165 stop:578 length:414 start_codon:yes stop_codon:yes gene_type:complete
MLLVGIDDSLELVWTGESDKIEFPGPDQWVTWNHKDLKIRGFKPTVFTIGGLTGRMRARLATSEANVADRIFDFCQAGVKEIQPRPQSGGNEMSVKDVIECLQLTAASMLMSVIVAASEGMSDPCSVQDLEVTSKKN